MALHLVIVFETSKACTCGSQYGRGSQKQRTEQGGLGFSGFNSRGGDFESPTAWRGEEWVHLMEVHQKSVIEIRFQPLGNCENKIQSEWLSKMPWSLIYSPALGRQESRSAALIRMAGLPCASSCRSPFLLCLSRMTMGWASGAQVADASTRTSYTTMRRRVEMRVHL